MQVNNISAMDFFQRKGVVQDVVNTIIIGTIPSVRKPISAIFGQVERGLRLEK